MKASGRANGYGIVVAGKRINRLLQDINCKHPTFASEFAPSSWKQKRHLMVTGSIVVVDMLDQDSNKRIRGRSDKSSDQQRLYPMKVESGILIMYIENT